MNHDKNRVIIFDTTLRDGERSLGASTTRDEMLRIAPIAAAARACANALNKLWLKREKSVSALSA